jgi:hypothetical protein
MAAWAVGLAACGGHISFDVPRPAEPGPTARRDTAIALLYDARTCAVDIASRHGTLTWHPPDAPWPVQTSGFGALLVAIVPVPPGTYTITGATLAASYAEGTSRSGRAMGYTDCHRRGATRRMIHELVEVPAHEVALATHDGSAIGFQQLLNFTLDAPPSWRAPVAAVVQRDRAQLIASIREAHEGYSIYRGCGIENALAVVHAASDPVVPRHASAPATIAGLKGSGIGGGCVIGGKTRVYFVRDSACAEGFARALGEELAAHPEPREIDIVVSGPVRTLSASSGPRVRIPR